MNPIDPLRNYLPKPILKGILFKILSIQHLSALLKRALRLKDGVNGTAVHLTTTVVKAQYLSLTIFEGLLRF